MGKKYYAPGVSDAMGCVTYSRYRSKHSRAYDYEQCIQSMADTMLRGWQMEQKLGPKYWRQGAWSDEISLAIHRDAEAYQDWEEENQDPDATWQQCMGSGIGRPKGRAQ